MTNIIHTTFNKPRSSLIMTKPTSTQTTFIGLALFWVWLAYAAGPDIHQDSYTRYQLSVQLWETSDWAGALTHIWNKPLSPLLYGASGQLGLFGARLTAVLIALLTLRFTLLWIQNLQGSLSQTEEALVLLLTAFQLPFFEQAIYTMSEMPAACVLIMALWLWSGGRHWQGFLVLGLLPLARLETALLMATGFVSYSWLMARRNGFNTKVLGKLLFWNALGSLPFVLWALAGWHITEHPMWMTAGSYGAYLRDLNPFYLLTINAWSNLPATAPLFVVGLIFLGMWNLLSKSMLKSNHARIHPTIWVALVIFLVDSLFLSAMVVYPKGSRFGDLAIAAFNARHTIIIAPLLTLLAFWGWKHWQQVIHPQRQTKPYPLGQPLFGFLILSGVVLACWLVFQDYFQVSTRTLGVKSAVHLGTVVVFLLLSWWVWLRPDFSKWLNRMTLLMLVVGFLALKPFFWYPLKWHDQRLQGQIAYCQQIEQALGSAPVRVIQDLDGAIARSCKLDLAPSPWTWPSFFLEELSRSSPGTLVLLELDQHRQIDSKYPANLQHAFNDKTSFEQVGTFFLGNSVPEWQMLVNRFTKRNRFYGWMLVRKK